MPSRTVSAGELRHRIQVQHEVNVGQQDNGEHITDWVTVATVSAKITPSGGSETFSGDQVSPNVSHMVTTRHGSHLDGYDSSWRIVFGTRIFEVESVVLRNEISGTCLDWTCKEAGRLTTDAQAGLVAGA